MSAPAVALLAALATAAPAWSWAPPPNRYNLNVVEGETTQPENSVAGVSAATNVEPTPQIRLRIISGGATIFQSTGRGQTWLSQVPGVGDVVTVESPVGTLVGSIDYDGLPSIEPTVCAGSTNFSGQRSGAETVAGGYYTDEAETDPYGHITGYRQVNQGQAQVTLLSGSAFGGNFLVPLSLGETVYASESVEVPIAAGTIFTYESETVRPVGACPAPPPPPPPPPPPLLPIKASILKLLPPRLRALLLHGLRDKVSVNQAGTVTQQLFLKGGRLPAYASSAHARHKAPPAFLLAQGTATAGNAGSVTVLLKATNRGRARMRSAGRLTAVLITTVRSATGEVMNLPARQLTLHR